CTYCKAPLDLENFSTSREVSNKKVIDLNEAKNTAAAAKNRAFLSGISVSDWREQLNLKLDRLREKESMPSASREKLLGEIRNREFTRPSQKLDEAEKDLFSSSPPIFHPLAQKTLEKLKRAAQPEPTGSQIPSVNVSPPPRAIDAESTVSIRKAK